MSELTTMTMTTTMTSKEMADLTEKRHDNVKRTIETLANQGVISYPKIEDGPKAANGVVEKLYRIGKRDSYIIVARLSPEFTARLVDRWQKLEEAAAKPAAALPDFTDPVVAAQAWIDQFKAKQALAQVNAAQAEKLAIAGPKADALDLIAAADGSTCITDAAKVLKVRPKDLFNWLQAHQWIYRRPGGPGWLAYQQRIQQCVLEHKVTTVERGDGSAKVIESVRITRKGLARLAEILANPPGDQRLAA
jgi:phage antirepressor YoqD-like protein